MILAAAVEFAFRSDGWIHIVQNGFDISRGPLGVLLYIPFVALFWFVPRRGRAFYLTVSSLLLALATLGAGYTATLICLVLVGLLAIRWFGQSVNYWVGIAVLTLLFATLLLDPQPFWLPPVKHPFYFYIHWAGIGYVYLKTLHVLIEVAKGSLGPPTTGDFFAYLLFAPTLRMGPIYRFDDFVHQLHRDHHRHRSVGTAAFRILVALVRLGATVVLMVEFPIDQLFDRPDELSTYKLVLSLYAAPMCIYLWFSGYIDLSVGIGRAMGFNVPENFYYPWRSTSVAEFWRRWHITLGAWVRDYIYIPLGGNRRHVSINYLITFLFVGLWHGTYLSYLMWALSQGVGMVCWRAWAKYWQRQGQADSALYRCLRRARLVGSPVNTALSWLLCFHYQIITIAWFMDENHAGRLFFKVLLHID